MERLIFAVTIAAALSVTSIAAAQTAAPYGNNSTTPGYYLGVGLGVSVLDDIDFDTDVLDEEAEMDAGFHGELALGYIFPRGPYSLRAEGEMALRGNGVDEFGGDEAIDDSAIAALSGMLNGYIDYYILPNTALTIGGGIGYATVYADVEVDIDGDNVQIFDEQDDGGFAYQGMVGARYDFAGRSTLEIGYTYFVVDDLTIDDEDFGDSDFDYLSHSFHLGYAYRF